MSETPDVPHSRNPLSDSVHCEEHDSYRDWCARCEWWRLRTVARAKCGMPNDSPGAVPTATRAPSEPTEPTLDHFYHKACGTDLNECASCHEPEAAHPRPPRAVPKPTLTDRHEARMTGAVCKYCGASGPLVADLPNTHGYRCANGCPNQRPAIVWDSAQPKLAVPTAAREASEPTSIDALILEDMRAPLPGYPAEGTEDAGPPNGNGGGFWTRRAPSEERGSDAGMTPLTDYHADAIEYVVMALDKVAPRTGGANLRGRARDAARIIRENCRAHPAGGAEPDEDADAICAVAVTRLLGLAEEAERWAEHYEIEAARIPSWSRYVEGYRAEATAIRNAIAFVKSLAARLSSSTPAPSAVPADRAIQRYTTGEFGLVEDEHGPWVLYAAHLTFMAGVLASAVPGGGAAPDEDATDAERWRKIAPLLNTWRGGGGTTHVEAWLPVVDGHQRPIEYVVDQLPLAARLTRSPRPDRKDAPTYEELVARVKLLDRLLVDHHAASIMREEHSVCPVCTIEMFEKTGDLLRRARRPDREPTP